MDKQKRIISMFDEIASSYDLANGVLTLGIDKLWRKNAVKKVKNLLPKASCIVDVACGSGDMVFSWREAYKSSKITGVDASRAMLENARTKLEKIEKRKKIDLKRQIALKQGYAQDMEFLESSSADIISIAYGIRNVMDIKGAFKEFNRVLKPGGLLVVLEFTNDPRRGVLSKLVGLYIEKILPLIGAVISKNYQAYKYLPSSIKDFLSLKDLQNLLEQGSFSVVHARSGISSLCIAKCTK